MILLLDEITKRHGKHRSEACEAIALLDQIIDPGGEDAPVMGRRPVRPELLEEEMGED